MAIQLGFSSKTICSFENRLIGCVYKTGTKYASKDEIELAVFKAELLLVVWVLGLRLAVLACVLRLLSMLLFDHSVSYGDKDTNGNTHKQAQTQNKMSSKRDENWRNR